MSADVENRVVQMEFDNAQFKQGVAETLEKIKELDRSLKLEEGTSGLEKAAGVIKTLDVSSVAEGFSEASSKLDKFRNVAIGVANTLTGIAKGGLISGGLVSAISAIPAVAKSISGGMTRASKLAQSRFQFEGLGVQGQELERIMSSVSNSVNDTAYGLDQASMVASMLFASGIKNVEQLETALMNVSNVAATFNAQYETIADVMTKVASKGKLQGEEILRLAHAGMNAKAVIAEYLQTEEGAAKYTGLIEKFGDTEEAVEDMSKKGVISFELFNDSLSKFEGNAKKSNETLQGVTANIGAALSRTTADFFLYTLHNVDGVIRVLNDVRTLINNLNGATKNLMGVTKDAEGNITHYGAVIQGVLNVLEKIHEAFDYVNGMGIDTSLDHRWKDFFGKIEPLVTGFFDRVTSITVPLVHAIFLISDAFREFFNVVIGVMTPIATAFDEVFGDAIVGAAETFEYILKQIVWGLRQLEPSEATVRLLHDAFKTLFSVISPVVNLFGGVFRAAIETVGIVLRGLVIVIDAVTQVIMAFFDAISPVTDILAEFISSLIDAIGGKGEEFIGFLSDTSKWLDGIAVAVKQGIPEIKKFFEPLRKMAESAAETLRNSGIVAFFQENAPKALNAAKRAFEGIQPALQALYDFLKPIGDAIGTTFVRGFEAVSDAIQNSGILEFVSGTASNLAGIIGLPNVFSEIGKSAEDSSEGFDAFGRRFGAAAVAARDGAIAFGGRLVDGLVSVGTTVWNVVGPALNWLMDLAIQVGETIAKAFADSGLSFEPVLEFFNAAGEALNALFENLKNGEGFEAILEFLDTLKENFGEMLDKLAPGLSSFVQNLGSNLDGVTEGPLKDLTNMIQGLADNLASIPDLVAKIPEAISGTIGGAFGGLGSLLKNPFAPEKAWADDGSGGAASSIEALNDEGFRLSEAINKFTGYLKSPLETARRVAGDTFTGVMKGIGDSINEGLSAINFETINLFIENCKNVVVSATAIWGTVTLVSVFESIREIFVGVAKWTDSINGVIVSVQNIMKSIEGVFKAISGSIDRISTAVAKDIKANVFLKYVLGTVLMIGTIVAAIMILGRMDKNELIQGAEAVGAIILVLLVYEALMIAMTKINPDAKGISTLMGLSGMGLALMMIARSIKKLGEMDPTSLQQGLTATMIILVLVGLLASLVGAVSKFGGRGAVVILALGLFLKLLVATISVYALMPWDLYLSGVEKIGIVILGLLGVAAIMSRFTGMGFQKSAGAIIAISASLVLIAIAIGALNVATMGDSEQALHLMMTMVFGVIAIAAALSFLADGGKKKKIGAATGAIAAISACLILMATAIGVLNLLTMGNPAQAVSLALVLIGMLLGMAGAISLIANKTRQLPNATRAIFNLTLAVVAIGVVLGALSFIASMNPMGFIGAVLGVSIVLAAMAGTVILMGRQGGEIANAVPAIFQLTLAIAAIGAAISAMLFFSGGNGANIAIAGAALAGTLILMAVALKVIGMAAGQAAIASTAMLELGAALAIMAVGIALLGSLDIGQVVQGFLAMVAALVILAVAAVAVSALSEFFVVLDGVLLALGVSVLLISASFLIFVLALERLGQVAPETFQRIIDSKDKMIGAFSAMGEAIAAAVMSFFGTLISGIGQGLSDMGAAIAGRGPEIGQSAMTVGKSIAEGIIYGLGGAILGVGSALVDGLRNAIGGAAQGIGGVIQDASVKMAADFTGHPELYTAAGNQNAEAVAEGVSESDAPEEAAEEVAQDVEEALPEAGKKVDSEGFWNEVVSMDGAPPELQEQMKNFVSPEMFENLGLDLGSVLPGKIMEGASESPVDPETLMGSLNMDSANFTPKAEEIGTSIGETVSTSAADTMQDTNPVEAAVGAQLDVISSHTVDYQARGEQNADGYNSGMYNVLSTMDISGALNATASQMAAALGPAIIYGKSVGTGFGVSEASSIRAAAGDVGSAASATTDSARSHADGYAKGREVGDSFGSGLYNGINSWARSIADEAARIVREAKNAAKEEENANSPSKDTYEYGEWFGQGFALGIRSTGDMVSGAAADMVVMAKDEADQVFGVMDSILDLVDWDSEPTITPILDLSEYEAGLARMHGLDNTPQIKQAGWAGRIYPSYETKSNPEIQNGGNKIEVHLDWNAGVTPNQMAQALAVELDKYNKMEA